MRATLPLIALLCATAAAADTPRTQELRQPPAALSGDSRAVCRDRIEQVRAASGLPRLDRGNASPDEQPLLIAAVDKRIGGCAVMVLRNNTSDIRPIPAAPEGPPRVRRIR
jgi:hypothetical protein